MRPTLGYVDAADVLHRNSITRDLCTILLPVWAFFNGMDILLPVWLFCYQCVGVLLQMRAFCYQCGYFVTSLCIFLPVWASFLPA